MRAEIKKAITDYVILYNKVEKVIKQTTHVTGELDITVLNEVRYAHRAMVDCLSMLAVNEDVQIEETKFAYAWRDATKGACIAINDAVDTIVLQAKYFIQELTEAFPNTSVRKVYGEDKFDQLLQSLAILQQKQTETREFRDNRVDEYVNMAASEELAQVVKFMQVKENLQNEMKLVEAEADRREQERTTELKIAQDSLAIATRNFHWSLFGILVAVTGAALAYLALK
jgi:hypothetical protein